MQIFYEMKEQIMSERVAWFACTYVLGRLGLACSLVDVNSQVMEYCGLYWLGLNQRRFSRPFMYIYLTNHIVYFGSI